MTNPQAYVLTVQLADLSNEPVAGVHCVIELESPQLEAIGSMPSETLFPDGVSGSTNASGILQMRLLPSSVVGNYKIMLGNYQRIFAMPAHDARLSELPDG